MSNLLYHYTSIETFYKMLERSLKVTEEGSLLIKFWATHCDFLNDRTEGKLFKQCLLSALNEYASLHSHKLTDKEIEQFNKMYSINDSFVISFSKHRDSLDMWRAYGANGKGICLGFDFSPTDPYMDSEGVFRPSETIDIKECKYFLPSENIDLKIVEDVYNKVITPELDTISAARRGFFISALPSPFPTILCIGHPILISIADGETSDIQPLYSPHSIIAAASATNFGSLPNS